MQIAWITQIFSCLIDTKMYINKMHNISDKKRNYPNLHFSAKSASSVSTKGPRHSPVVLSARTTRERETETTAERNYWLGDVEISTREGNISRMADGPLKFFKYSFSPRCSDLFLLGIPRGRFHSKNPPCKKFMVSPKV